MGVEEFAPYFGVIVASFALSCLSTVCWCRQRRQLQQLQERIIAVEQRPLQQFQLLAHDTGYGQAYNPVPIAPPAPTYYAPPAPSAPYYGTNVV